MPAIAPYSAHEGARRSRQKPALSCGVIVTDGLHLLLGHATQSPRWDIPKGLAEPGETHVQAARRELLEETGLAAPADALAPAGVYAYRPRKDLALFVWHVRAMPDPVALHCTSTFTRGGITYPEFDRFAAPPWIEALHMIGKSMAQILAGLMQALTDAS